MHKRVRQMVVLGLLLAAGCMFQNEGPAKKLSDAVQEMNKATRWGQLGQATLMVEPVYRMQFVKNHAQWGGLVQLADSEVVHVELAPGHETAVAIVAYEWYHASAMTLHQSVVRQRWSRVGSGYALLSEVVVQGDPRIFGPSSNAATPAPSPSVTDTPAPNELSLK
jgi:hypothetical protein